MPKVHLTDLSVRALKAPENGTVTYFDDVTPAFGVRVSYGGKKTWIVIRGKRRSRTRLRVLRWSAIPRTEKRTNRREPLVAEQLGYDGRFQWSTGAPPV